MNLSFTVTLIFVMMGLVCPALAEVPAPDPSHLIIFVQYDMPNAERFKFDQGFQFFLKSLPPETHVEFYFFMKDMYRPVINGKAEGQKWPVISPSFVVANPSTTPYENLIHYLKEGSIHNRYVIFVTNGLAQGLQNVIDRGGFNRGRVQFSPQLYEPFAELIAYCQANNVIPLGLFVPPGNSMRVELNDITLEGFRYVINQSGGKAYFNYTSFEGIFKSILEKHLGIEVK